METRRAVVTGVTGQDGSSLAELLLKKGYEVYGMIRRHSQPREVYNLASQSHVHTSWKQPTFTADIRYIRMTVRKP